MDYRTLYDLKHVQCEYLLEMLGRVRTYLITGPRTEQMDRLVAKAIEKALPEEE